MSSNIVETVPVDNASVDKALIRANFRYAKEEIEALQEQTSLAWQIAFGLVSI